MYIGRKLGVFVLLFWGITLGGPREAQGQDRRLALAFVNMEQIFSEYHKTRIADGQLRAQAEEFNRERQVIVAELQEAQEQFNTIREEARDVTLTQEARENRQLQAEEQLVDIRDMESRLSRFDELRSKQLEDQSRRMRRGLVQDIREAVRAYARDQGLDAVLDASGQSVSGIELALYVDGRADITEAVLAILNRDAPGAER